jgi:hypothetical protein
MTGRPLRAHNRPGHRRPKHRRGADARGARRRPGDRRGQGAVPRSVSVARAAARVRRQQLQLGRLRHRGVRERVDRARSAGDLARSRHVTSSSGGHSAAGRTLGFVPKRRVGIFAWSPFRLSSAFRTAVRSCVRLATSSSSAHSRDRVVRRSGLRPSVTRASNTSSRQSRRTRISGSTAGLGLGLRTTMNVTAPLTETLVIPHQSGRMASAFG